MKFRWAIFPAAAAAAAAAAPPWAEAKCDGDDLVIEFWPTSGHWSVLWGEIGQLMDDSPHRFYGPGSGDVTVDGYVYVYVHDLHVYFPLGDFTCGDPGDGDNGGGWHGESEMHPVYGCTFDGRLNDDFCGYPVAVYRVDGKLVIYALDPANGAGLLVLDMRESELPASAVNPFTGQMIWVNELSTGEVQINTAYADGKEYIFVIGSVSSYHLAR